MRLTYTAVLTPNSAGGWLAEIPALPGCQTEGNSVEDALTMIQDAMEGYLSVLLEDGDLLPVDRRDVTVSLGRKRQAIVRKVTVSLAVQEVKVA
jgi:predicted RNase H-like HicB family nuclease